MQLSDIFHKFDKIAIGAPFRLVDLEICSVPALENHDDLEARISGWKGTGWVARQSGVLSVKDGEGDDRRLGAPVAAELLQDRSTSHQLRCGPKGWCITTIRETDGASHLAETMRHLTLGGQVAVYQRYWSLAPNGQIDVAAWRMSGLEELGG